MTTLTHPNLSDSCKVDFYRAALKDTSGDISLVRVKVKDSVGTIKTRLVIPKALFVFYRRHKGVSHEQYLNIMTEKLLKDEPIAFEEFGELPSGMEVQEYKRAKRKARKGKEYFLRYFFYSGQELKPGHSFYFNALSNYLFDFGVLIRYGDNMNVLVFYNSKCIQ